MPPAAGRVAPALCVLTCLAMLLQGSALASAQEIHRADDGTLSVTGVEVPLERLVQAIAPLHALETVVLHGEIGTLPVTISLDGTTPRAALTAILQAAGVNYVLTNRRLVAGPADGGPATRPREGAPFAPAPDMDHSDQEVAWTPDATVPFPLATDDRSEAASEAYLHRVELERALLSKPPRRPALVALPFADGASPVLAPGPGAATGTASLPGLSAVSATTPRRPSAGTAAPGPVDPALQQLLDVLLPPER